MAEAHYAAILLNLYSLAIGFTVAGTFAASFAMLTGEPLKFEMAGRQPNHILLIGMVCRVVAGPFIILRNTLRAVFIAKREPYWVMMAIVIASLWSFCQGVVILETACQLGACS